MTNSNLPEISEIFPSLQEASADQAKLMVNALYAVATYEGNDGTLNDANQERQDLIALKKSLRERGINIGKVVGIGGRSIIFEVNDAKNQPLQHSVIRIEARSDIKPLDSPVVLQPIETVYSEKNMAVIVPKGASQKFSPQEVAKSFAVINSRGRHELERLSDMNHPIESQFMGLPGIDMPVLTDLNAIRTALTDEESNALDEARTNAIPTEKYKIKHYKASYGDVESFCTKHNIDYVEVMNSRVNDDELNKLDAAAQAIDKIAKEELSARGIKLSVPTSQSRVAIQPLAPNQVGLGA